MKKHILAGLATTAALIAFSMDAQAQLLGGAVNGTLNGSVGGSIHADPSIIGSARDRAMAPVGRVKDRTSDTVSTQRARAEGAARGAAGSATGTATGAAGTAAHAADASAAAAASGAASTTASGGADHGATAPVTPVTPVTPLEPAAPESSLLDVNADGSASADAAFEANGTRVAPQASTPTPAAESAGKPARDRDNDTR